MILIDSLGRSRIGTWLAWLAVVSMGALAVGRDTTGIEALSGRAEQATWRALNDAPPHVLRSAAVKLTVAGRLDGADRRDAAGPDPAILPPVIRFAAPVAVTENRAAPPRTQPRRSGGAVTPYSARAPPVIAI